MSDPKVKRLRIFAGPNGSGKSTLYNYLIGKNYFKTYFHVNPDEITKELPIGLNLESYPIQFDENRLKEYLSKSSFQKNTKLNLAEEVLVTGKNIRSKEANNITYLSAAIAEFIRQEMLLSESSFSFESVFSHPSKVDFIRQAKEVGYKTYFYFIATQDYQINQERVLNRVQLGEHDVPPDKIRDRYYKTMENLYEALRLTDRAFLFDNSEYSETHTYQMFVEKSSDQLHFETDKIPEWFRLFVLDKMQY